MSSSAFQEIFGGRRRRSSPVDFDKLQVRRTHRGVLSVLQWAFFVDVVDGRVMSTAPATSATSLHQACGQWATHTRRGAIARCREYAGRPCSRRASAAPRGRTRSVGRRIIYYLVVALLYIRGCTQAPVHRRKALKIFISCVIVSEPYAHWISEGEALRWLEWEPCLPIRNPPDLHYLFALVLILSTPAIIVGEHALIYVTVPPLSKWSWASKYIIRSFLGGIGWLCLHSPTPSPNRCNHSDHAQFMAHHL
jgi:hypothetical protein